MPRNNVVRRSGGPARWCAPLVLAAAVLLAWAPRAQAQRAWNWDMPAEEYKALAVFERDQYDKAAKQLRDGVPASAASEFEKFEVQFPDSPGLAYVKFLRGYSQQQTHNRLAAIKTYDEVLDYYGDKIVAAAPSIYYKGLAQTENGDIGASVKTFKAMVANPEYQKHPLAAGALRLLADACYDNKDYDQAVGYWKQAIRDFGGKMNPAETAKARDSIIAYYIETHKYDEYESWRLADPNHDDPGYRRTMSEHVWRVALDSFHYNSRNKYFDMKPEVRVAMMKPFLEYYLKQKDWYEKSQDLWTFYDHALQFLCYCWSDKPQRDKLLEEAIQYVQKLPEDKNLDEKFAFIVDCLRIAGDAERAHYTVTHIKDKLLKAWKEMEVTGSEHKWKEALEMCQAIEAMGDDGYKSRGMWERARILKDETHEYDKAIKLYMEIDRPPDSLWQIQECYWRAGKLKEAITQLTEIENMFPPNAPEAAWQKVAYFDGAKDDKNAIAQAKRIMKIYPRTQASSKAHQYLKAHNVDSGGGVLDDEDAPVADKGTKNRGK